MTYKGNLFKDALEAVMPTAKYQGARVLVPVGISERVFDKWVDSWSAETFAGITGGTAEEILEIVRDDSKLIEVGNGRYTIEASSALEGSFKPLVFKTDNPDDPTVQLILEFPRGP